MDDSRENMVITKLPQFNIGFLNQVNYFLINQLSKCPTPEQKPVDFSISNNQMSWMMMI